MSEKRESIPGRKGNQTRDKEGKRAGICGTEPPAGKQELARYSAAFPKKAKIN